MPRINEQRFLHAQFLGALSAVIESLHRSGIPLEVYETARSPWRQAELFAVGRQTGKIGATVTRARAWESFHQFGLAADCVFRVDGKWTWNEPSPGMWREYAQRCMDNKLRVLSFERPHTELPYRLSELRAGRLPDGGGDAWRNWLEGQIELWGQVARPVSGIVHPAAPPLLSLYERPPLVGVA